MKMVLYYFSGTGNTRFIAEKFLEKAVQAGQSLAGSTGPGSETLLVPVEQAQRDGVVIESDTIFGIGFPVYDLMPPEIVCSFVQTLPEARPGQSAFVFSTYTSFPLDANRYVIELLQQKGYRVVAEQSFKAPGRLPMSMPIRNCRLSGARRFSERAQTVLSKLLCYRFFVVYGLRRQISGYVRIRYGNSIRRFPVWSWELCFTVICAFPRSVPDAACA